MKQLPALQSKSEGFVLESAVPLFLKSLLTGIHFVSQRDCAGWGLEVGKSIEWRGRTSSIFQLFGKAWIELFNLSLPGVKCAGIVILFQLSECL